MRPRANWPVCPPEPTAAPPITSPAPSPTPPCRGLALYGPPTKAPGPWPPGKVAPFDPPFPPSRSANWRIPPPPLLKRKVPPPCVHPGPRASRAGFASPPLHLPSTPPAGAANSPAAPTGAPRPPSQGREAPPAAPRPGLGEGGTAGGAWLRGDRRAGGVVPRGSPCQGPHRKIPRHAGIPHATQRSHSCGPSLPQPRTVGPGSLLHRLTDPIWGVKIQNAVEVARNCSGGQFLYGGGPCTTKTPYKVGHFFEKLGDIWVLRACLRGRAPPKAPREGRPPSTLQPRPTTPDNDDAISPTPSRGPLHRPPSPGGEGAGSTVPSIKDPASPPAWKGCPLDPRSGAPRPSRRANWRITKGHHIFPQSPRGGGPSTGHTGRGGMLYTIPPSNAPPPGRPGRLAPSTPPASTPGQAVERTGQSLKAPYLSPEPGASPTTPLPEGPGSLVPTIRSPGVRSIGTVRPPRRKVRPS
ncbi:hypothetical protein N7530_012969 [Penicillium desertorum]|uniref:Uncharacterized protein n=1 Tax=Penicillium desertorum TaxID=1303715 RepID=A0A9X0BFF4_9EURO|nr:hypothetical protein N7530_012969 [Penicillium desertorum]